MIYFDTETCGLHGPTVLLQYAEDEGDIILWNIWEERAADTLELIEYIVYHEGGVCGFNLAFDWFHLCQTYTTLNLLPDQRAYPIDIINEYAKCEKYAWFGHCLKPVTAHDVMLFARKGPYQSTMNRKDIKIKKFPTALAFKLAKELDERIPLKDVYFARKQNPAIRWQVVDIYDEFGDLIIDFKDIVLRFAPSSALKALYEDVFNIKATHFWEVALPKAAQPKEFGYAPYAYAVGSPDDWNHAWPEVITTHTSHWYYNRIAREYANDDVKMTRELYHYFGDQEPGDNDSLLACLVGAVRWHGFALNLDKIKALQERNLGVLSQYKFNGDAPASCRAYLEQAMDETERLALIVDGSITTKAVVLEEIAKWTDHEVHEACGGMGCNSCTEGLIDTDKPHLAAERAQEILDARHSIKENQLFDKLLTAGRFFPSFNVIGTKSTRMSGADGLNPQGIKRATQVRECFTLADKSQILCGGDYEAQEVSIMDAAYMDPVLHEELQQTEVCRKCRGTNSKCKECKGTGVTKLKIHALWGMIFFPGLTYAEIIESKGAANPWKDYYTRCKNGVFALCYFGEDYTLMNRVGLGKEEAANSYDRIWKKYKVMGVKRKKVVDMFCSMRQPGGIGTKVEWHEPADYIESMLGFRRYFTLENNICKALFDLAQKPPKEWKNIKIKVRRRDRDQTASGAIQSALFAAAFALQAQNMRAAGNHIIQSTGADITKQHQCKIWAIQPIGINNWRVAPINIHDEIMTVTHTAYAGQLIEIKDEVIKELQPIIPLIAIDWQNNIASWADK
jgi:hypothetical protein